MPLRIRIFMNQFRLNLLFKFNKYQKMKTKSFSIVSTIFLLVFSFTAFAQPSPKKDLSLEDIWMSPALYPNTISGLNSMNDGEHYTTQEGDRSNSTIEKYNYKTGKKVATLLSSSDLKNPINGEKVIFSDYVFNADESKVLLTTGVEKIYRHSFVAAYFIYDFKTKKLTALDDVIKQQLPSFSPKGDMVAFVQNNNIFIKNLNDNSLKQVTTDGKRNNVINGATDWVYEEEFGFDRAFFWNEDGSRIAFYRFDESKVKEFNMAMYGSLYPKDYRFKYPKAGEDNSIVEIYTYDLKSANTYKMDIGNETNQYIPRIAWTKDVNVLCMARMNRHQSKLELLMADATSGKSKVIYTQESQQYIDIHESADNFFFFLDDKKHFILQSDKGDFMHLYLFDVSGKEVNQITKGNYDVKDLLGYDEKSKTVFYTSTEVTPTEQHTYSVKFDGSSKKQLTSKAGFNNSEFSSTYKYFINTHSDANTPHYITLNDVNGKEIRVIEDNKELKEKLASLNLSKKEFFSFKTSEGIELNGWMIKPANFDPAKKYPVFQHFYGGPGHNEVENEWGYNDYFWHQLLAQKGYIVVTVDNRGTGGRGNQFKKCTYKQLGKFEVADQIETAKYMGSLPYVDKTRIGVQGWSFGGYLTSLCMTKGADYFKAGIAVAPVTNWRYYDSIYTERFLQTPQENAEGYDDNSPINHVKKLKGAYLLVHGTADDNVHYQNSIEMVNALVKANKQFDMFMYPDKNHSIAGGTTRIHLYTKMTDFILKNL